MSKKQKSTKAKSSKNISPAIIALIIVLGIIIVVGGLFFAIKAFNRGETNSYSVPSEYYVDYPDVEQYFEDNSDILSVTPVNDSNDVLSEREVCELFEERGFTQQEITTSFSIDGDYLDDLVISSSSSDKHPVYQTDYVTNSKMVWTIMVIDGMILAYPVSYSLEYSDRVPITVSESEELISYDFTTNSFYRTIPSDDTMVVFVVDKIDAKTLESLTMEALANG